MKTTADYIDALRVKLNVDSDFKAMNALGVKHRQQVSEWRQLHGGFSEDLSVRVAEALEIDPAEVLLAMEIQREKNDKVRSIWERIASNMHYATAAVLVLAVVLAPALPDNLSAFDLAGLEESGDAVYYVK